MPERRIAATDEHIETPVRPGHGGRVAGENAAQRFPRAPGSGVVEPMPERVVAPADEDIEAARSPGRHADTGRGVAGDGGCQELDRDVPVAPAVEGPGCPDVVI